MKSGPFLNKKYSVKTFGCKVNTYDSALIQKNLNKKAWNEQSVNSSEKAVHIVNTCAVTEEAVKEAQRWVCRYKKKHPRDRILVTGCAAQVETEKFSSLEEVDFVVANSHKSELAEILENKLSKTDDENKTLNSAVSSLDNKTFKSSIFKKSDLGKEGGVESGHTRLFLKIQDGCDSFCTFCIIPFARGKSRSLPPADLVRSVQKHYEKGVREVVLTGVHIGDYRVPGDEKKGLAELVRVLLKETKIPRLRLSSLEPVELSAELLDLFKSSRVCPHFHLSVQSVQSEVLRRMKRQYGAEEVEKSLMDIHQNLPRAFVGMDLIAGFAGESQDQFEETYTRLKNLPWTKIHVFPYSPRRYTYAEKAYSSWPRSVIMKRAGLLRHLSEDRLKSERSRQIGTIKSVLPLKNKIQEGISRDYWAVKWDFSDLRGRNIESSIREENRKNMMKNGELSVRIHSTHEQFCVGYVNREKV